MISYTDQLYHHGIKGQKWGVRRYQNADGSLTTAGLHRYYGPGAKHQTRSEKNNSNSRNAKASSSAKSGHRGLSDGQKKALKIGAAVAATGLAAYGAYKLHEVHANRKVIENVQNILENPDIGDIVESTTTSHDTSIGSTVRNAASEVRKSEPMKLNETQQKTLDMLNKQLPGYQIYKDAFDAGDFRIENTFEDGSTFALVRGDKGEMKWQLIDKKH